MSIFSPPHILNSARWKNMRIGLLGGSFNPAHAGHVYISEIALKYLKLDAVWWLVAPQNPLKSNIGLLSVDERANYACGLLKNYPRILATDIEKSLGTRYSYDSVKRLNIHYSNTKFVWITGMDNAHNLYLWKNWKKLLDNICMLHIARGSPVDLVKNCSPLMLSNHKNIILNHATKVDLSCNTTYWVLKNRLVDISSTKIRDKNILN